MVVAFAHEIQDRAFLRGSRRHGDMASLPGDRHRPITGGNQRAHAEAGARPNDPNRSIICRLTTADLNAILLAEVRDRGRIGGKVVDHAKSFETELSPERIDRKCPWVICQRDLVAGHRRGNRQHRAHRQRRRGLLCQVRINRIGKRSIVAQRIDPRCTRFAIRLHQCKARVCGADISDQTDIGHSRQGARPNAIPASRTHDPQ